MSSQVYKLGKGVEIEPTDVKEKLEEYFGEVDFSEVRSIEDLDGTEHTGEFYFVNALDVVGLDIVAASCLEKEQKKNRLGIIFDETPLEEIEDINKVRKTRESKNQFLKDLTGRTSKQRRETMKNKLD